MNVELRTECESAHALMSSVMRGGAPLDGEYPLIFAPESPGRIVVLEEDGQVRSTCAVLTRDLVTPSARLRVGMIGSVATDPEHRGRGLATRLLREAEDKLREEGCLFSLLWADSEEFYAARGYQRIGTELDFILGPELLRKLPDAGEVRLFEPEDAQQLHALYARHPERVERTMGETLSLLNAPGMEILVREDAGQLEAYTCLGRGADLANVVHEWGGKAEGVAACLHAHMKRRALKGEPQDLFLIAPPSETDLARYLTKVGAPSSSGVLGMGKLLDLRRLVELYAWFLGPDGGVRVDARPAKLSPDGRPGLRVQGPNMALLIGADDAFRALFSPAGETGDLDYLRRALGLPLAGLPLTPFVWGLDSI